MKKNLSLVLVLTAIFTFAVSMNAYAIGWKKATTPDDVLNFLNGTGSYQGSVTSPKICAVNKGNYIEFYVFYKGKSKRPGRWGWKKSTTADDVKNFIDGTGAYSVGVKKAEICAVNKGRFIEYYIFYQK